MSKVVNSCSVMLLCVSNNHECSPVTLFLFFCSSTTRDQGSEISVVIVVVVINSSDMTSLSLIHITLVNQLVATTATTSHHTHTSSLVHNKVLN